MVRTFLRAFGAFVTLLALLVGLPAVLGYGTWAIVLHARPRQTSLTQLLTTPDNGNLFLWALVAVGWIAWLAFALSVLVEIPAQLRGRVARRLPALGWSQRLAGGLVGAVLALMPMAGGALAATGAPAPRLAVTAPLAPEFAAQAALQAAPDTAPAPTSSHGHHPHYVVRATRPAETLWSIAERTLGSGERWREIAALNEGRPMDARHRVFDVERPLQPGWHLLLPRDARITPASAPAPAATASGASSVTSARDHEVTVRPGDTLSAIAQREMGHADAWPQLYAANRGVAAPDGVRLTDPDVIEPGMRLTIPGSDPDSDSGGLDGALPPPPTPGSGAGSAAGSGAGASPTGTPSPAPGTAAGGAFSHGSGSGGTTHPTPVPTPTPAPASASAGSHGGHQSGTQFAVAAGTSVLSAVLLGTVALRRSRRRSAMPRQTPQHRASGRPPRPPEAGTPPLVPASVPLPPAPPAPGPYLPTSSGPRPDQEPGQEQRLGAAAQFTEQAAPQPGQFAQHGQAEQFTQPAEAARQQSARDLDLLGRALRSMARNVAREGRRLPPINVVRVTAAHTVELHLVAPSPPVAPFRAAHASTVWWCTPDAPGLLGPEAAAVVPSPYPALVSLGETADGATVLVDLEAIRLLHVSGEPHDIARVLRTLALELTFTPLADRVGVHVVGVAQELAAVADDRLVVHPDLEHAVAALQRRDTSVRSALVQAGAATPREARSRGLGGDEWAPEVVLCAGYPTGDTPEALGRLLDARPRGSVAVITAAPPQGAGPVARWTLPAAGHGVVPGLEMEIQLQKLDDGTYHHWLRLLGADLVPRTVTTTAPPPSWPSTGPLDVPPAVSSRFPEPAPYAPPNPAPAAPATRESSPVSRRFLEPGSPVPTGPAAYPPAGLTPRPPQAALPVTPQRQVPAADSPAAPATGRFPSPADTRASQPPAQPPHPTPVTGRFPAPAAPQQNPRPWAAGPTPPAASTATRFPAPGAPVPLPNPTPPPPAPTSDRFPAAGSGPAPGAPAAPGQDPRPWAAGPAGVEAPGAGTSSPVVGRFPAAGTAPAPQQDPRPWVTEPDAAQASRPSAPGPVVGRFPAAGSTPGPTAPAPGAPAAPGLVVGRLPAAQEGGSMAGRFPMPARRLGAAGHPEVPGGAEVVVLPGPDPRVPVRDTPVGVDSRSVFPPSDPWILALLAAPPAAALAGEAKLRVLGPVELVGAAGPVQAEWRAGLVEVAARRALGPAQGAYVPAEAIGRLREWLGDGPGGRPVNLGCDWEDFQALRTRGLGDSGHAGDTALARALALVRGAPFAEAAYPWAESLRAGMTAAVVDVAHELTLRRLRAGDHRGAEAAANRGLVAEPDAELLLRDLVLVHADADDGPQLQRTVARLETKSARTGVPLEPETTALIDEMRSPAVDPLSRR